MDSTINNKLPDQHQKPQPGNTTTIGKQTENAALHYLTEQGLKLISRNYRAKTGEIDLIMEHNKDIVFIEVRYRKNHSFGSGAESVNHKKQQKLIKTARFFIQNNRKLATRNFRFDVISITLKENNFEINWIDSAFDNTCNNSGNYAQ